MAAAPADPKMPVVKFLKEFHVDSKAKNWPNNATETLEDFRCFEQLFEDGKTNGRVFYSISDWDYKSLLPYLATDRLTRRSNNLLEDIEAILSESSDGLRFLALVDPKQQLCLPWKERKVSFQFSDDVSFTKNEQKPVQEVNEEPEEAKAKNEAETIKKLQEDAEMKIAAEHQKAAEEHEQNEKRFADLNKLLADARTRAESAEEDATSSRRVAPSTESRICQVLESSCW